MCCDSLRCIKYPHKTEGTTYANIQYVQMITERFDNVFFPFSSHNEFANKEILLASITAATGESTTAAAFTTAACKCPTFY